MTTAEAGVLTPIASVVVATSTCSVAFAECCLEREPLVAVEVGVVERDASSEHASQPARGDGWVAAW